MKFLAVDTATEACSLALQIGEQRLSRFICAGRSHTEQLLPMFQSLLAEAGLSPGQLDAYVCGVGPGSFAGVRIGVSFVKGLALAQDRPVVAVSSLAMLAAAAMAQGQERVLCAIDARMDEVYFAAFARDAAGLPALLGEPRVCAPGEVPRHEGSWAAAGSGWQRYEASLRAASAAQFSRIDAQALPQAEQALRIALPELRAGRTIGAAQLSPLYLRNKVALTLIEQRARPS